MTIVTPRDRSVRRSGLMDRSLLVLRQGYTFLPSRRSRYDTDAFETRLLGERALCVGGRAGTVLFYDGERVKRDGALPHPLQHVLFGDGAVHGLDGAAHHHRKAMFLGLLTADAGRDIAHRAEAGWRAAMRDSHGEPFVVFGAAVEILGRAVTDWAGIPAERVPRSLHQELADIVDGFGSSVAEWPGLGGPVAGRIGGPPA